jgi:cytochrome P450
MQTVGLWTRPLAYLEGCRAQYGKRFTLNLLGQDPFVLLSDPGEVKELFTAPPEDLHPGAGAQILEPVLGPGSLLLLDGEKHLARRRLILPAFRANHTAELERMIAEVAATEIARWPRGRALALHPRLQALTLEVMLRTVFGWAESERIDELRPRMTAMVDYGNSNPLSTVPAEQLPKGFGPHASFARLRSQVDELLYAENADRRAAEAAGGPPPPDGGGVLETLIAARDEAGEPMPAEEIRDELMTLLVVGHETTGTELAWAFERLVRSPDVLRRLNAELDAGSDTYLRAVIQETLRRRPALPTSSPRKVGRRIEIGGWSYDPGVQLVANIYLLHHDPEIYPEPYAFRPERFLEREPGTYTWIPFGGGRRRCIGSGFAMLEMAVILRAVLARAELSAGDGPGSTRAEVSRRRSFAIGPGRGAETLLRDRAVPIA